MRPNEYAVLAAAAAMEIVNVCGEDAELIASLLVAVSDQVFLMLAAQKSCPAE